MQVVPQDVPVTREWVATLKGFVNTDIRSKVSGYLLKQNYVNGAAVAKGALLFQVDPRPFEAAVDHAKATLEQAQGAVEEARAQLLQAKATQQKMEAELGKTEIDVTRYTPLAKAKAISQEELDNAVQANRAANAQVEAAKASVAAAASAIDARVSSVAAAKAALPALRESPMPRWATWWDRKPLRLSPRSRRQIPFLRSSPPASRNI
jgi:membrane fusion protein (multidrug efflux system)